MDIFFLVIRKKEKSGYQDYDGRCSQDGCDVMDDNRMWVNGALKKKRKGNWRDWKDEEGKEERTREEGSIRCMVRSKAGSRL